MPSPDWNAPSKLLMIGGEPVNNNRLGRGTAVKDGPLSSLISEVLAMPQAEHWRYSIVQRAGPMLDCVAIRTLGARADFPTS